MCPEVCLSRGGAGFLLLSDGACKESGYRFQGGSSGVIGRSSCLLTCLVGCSEGLGACCRAGPTRSGCAHICGVSVGNSNALPSFSDAPHGFLHLPRWRLSPLGLLTLISAGAVSPSTQRCAR